MITLPELMLQEHYLPFPTREAGIILAMEEAGLDWVIWDSYDEMIQSKPSPDTSFIHIRDRDDYFAVRSIDLFANTYRHIHDIFFGTTTHLDMSFHFRPQYLSPEYISTALYNYNRFLLYEWPFFWSLAGLVFDSIDEISSLAINCIEYFYNFDFDELHIDDHGYEPDFLRWQYTIDNVHGYVSYS